MNFEVKSEEKGLKKKRKNAKRVDLSFSTFVRLNIIPIWFQK